MPFLEYVFSLRDVDVGKVMWKYLKKDTCEARARDISE